MSAAATTTQHDQQLGEAQAAERERRRDAHDRGEAHAGPSPPSRAACAGRSSTHGPSGTATTAPTARPAAASAETAAGPASRTRIAINAKASSANHVPNVPDRVRGPEPAESSSQTAGSKPPPRDAGKQPSLQPSVVGSDAVRPSSPSPTRASSSAPRARSLTAAGRLQARRRARAGRSAWPVHPHAARRRADRRRARVPAARPRAPAGPGASRRRRRARARPLRVDVIARRSAVGALLRDFHRAQPEGGARGRRAAGGRRGVRRDPRRHARRDLPALPTPPCWASPRPRPRRAAPAARRPGPPARRRARSVRSVPASPAHRIWIPGIVDGSEWASVLSRQLAAAFGLDIDALGPASAATRLLETLAGSADGGHLRGRAAAAPGLRRVPVRATRRPSTPTRSSGAPPTRTRGWPRCAPTPGDGRAPRRARRRSARAEGQPPVLARLAVEREAPLVARGGSAAAAARLSASGRPIGAPCGVRWGGRPRNSPPIMIGFSPPSPSRVRTG